MEHERDWTDCADPRKSVHVQGRLRRCPAVHIADGYREGMDPSLVDESTDVRRIGHLGYALPAPAIFSTGQLTELGLDLDVV